MPPRHRRGLPDYRSHGTRPVDRDGYAHGFRMALIALPVGSLAFALGPTAFTGGAGPPAPSSCPSCLRGGESRSRGSWWPYPMGLSRTGKVSLVTSAIFHNEDTKGTKKRSCGRATGGFGLQADGNRPLPTDNAIRAFRIVRRDRHAGLLRAGGSQPVVRPCIRGRVCIGIGVWISSRGVAVRGRRGDLVARCPAPVAPVPAANGIATESPQT